MRSYPGPLKYVATVNKIYLQIFLDSDDFEMGNDRCKSRTYCRNQFNNYINIKKKLMQKIYHCISITLDFMIRPRI